MHKFPSTFLILLSVLFITACASQNGWTPTVDTSASPGTYQTQPYPQQYPARAQQPVAQPQQRAVQPPPRQYQNPPPAPATAPPPRRNYTQDLTECQMMAKRVSGYTPEETVKGGLIGGAVGAAAGAAIGAATGNAGKGAAIGAAAGGIGGGAYKGIDAEKKYKQTYINCMRNRGWNVVNP